MHSFFKNSLFFVFVFLLVSCQSRREYTTKPTKSILNPESDLLEVNLVAYHLSDSLSRVYVEIKNENLLYKRPDTTKAFYSTLKIGYKLVYEANPKLIADSGSYYLKDRAENEYIGLKSIFSQFDLKAKRGLNFYLEVEIVDLSRRIKYIQGLTISKQNNFGAQNYLITQNDSVVFKTNFSMGDELIIQFTQKDISRVIVQCFFKDFGPALPPFSNKEFAEPDFLSDSTFILSLGINQFKLTLPEYGFYHVQSELNDQEGINLFTYNENFPGVGSSEEMIQCTRYIMSKEEFEECQSDADQKSCIDNFWLKRTGSRERAKELLKKYYGRVKEANKLYSSYTQGWKTDRGMIYIVFGPPLNIYRSKKDEVWVYGNEANPNSMRFIFNKKANPYSNNYYILERSQFYKDAWYAAVEQWRAGLMYSESNR